MKKYVEPLIFVVELSEEDIITSSGFDPNETKKIGIFDDPYLGD